MYCIFRLRIYSFIDCSYSDNQRFGGVGERVYLSCMIVVMIEINRLMCFKIIIKGLGIEVECGVIVKES